MLIVKSKDEPEIEKKKAKYADGVCSKSFKLNGVKKLLIVGLLPKVQENYHNLMMMLAELDLSGIDQILCADIKWLGRVSASTNKYICTEMETGCCMRRMLSTKYEATTSTFCLTHSSCQFS